MKNYSIVRIGDGYVVQADEKSVLKISSRRRAAKLVTRAAELLGTPSPPQIPGEAQAKPSIAPDPGIIPASGITLDPGITLDSGIVADPSEVP
jgi:hypothetical protein